MIKYNVVTFNIYAYGENRITEELNLYIQELTLIHNKKCKIITMNLLANGWIKFLIEID